MSALKQKLQEKIAAWRPRTERLVKEFSDVKLDEVNIGQAIGGMRDIKCLVTDISYLDPLEGIRFRGLTIPEVLEKLPKAEGGEMPSVEGFFYFLLTGDIPTDVEVEDVKTEFASRKNVPSYVFDVIKAMPIDSHPMVMFSSAILSLQKESVFAKKYHEGLAKNLY